MLLFSFHYKQAFYAIRWICRVYKATAHWTIKSTIWTIIETPTRIIIKGFGPFITHPTDKIKFFPQAYDTRRLRSAVTFFFLTWTLQRTFFSLVQSEREKCEEIIKSASIPLLFFFFSIFTLDWRGNLRWNCAIFFLYFFFLGRKKNEPTTAISKTLYEFKFMFAGFHTQTLARIVFYCSS